MPTTSVDPKKRIRTLLLAAFVACAALASVVILLIHVLPPLTRVREYIRAIGDQDVESAERAIVALSLEDDRGFRWFRYQRSAAIAALDQYFSNVGDSGLYGDLRPRDVPAEAAPAGRDVEAAARILQRLCYLAPDGFAEAQRAPHLSKVAFRATLEMQVAFPLRGALILEGQHTADITLSSGDARPSFGAGRMSLQWANRDGDPRGGARVIFMERPGLTADLGDAGEKLPESVRDRGSAIWRRRDQVELEVGRTYARWSDDDFLQLLFTFRLVEVRPANQARLEWAIWETRLVKR